MELSAGDQLGAYEILAKVGAGGTGEVYRAHDAERKRDVAIKVLSRHLTASVEARKRFEQEAHTLSRLHHPNICTLYEVGHANGVDFLVMEYLEGETLVERLQEGPFTPDDLLSIAIQVADGLGSAHRAGVLHRNLRPSNVMLTRSGVKLMDFAPTEDAAAAEGEPAASPAGDRAQDAEGADLGKLRYMAPERLEGKPGDARSDVFSFGAVLYEMATGQPAFEGKSEQSVVAAVLEQDPAPISTLDPLMPPALERLVRICLAKNAQNRLPSADGLQLLLEWIRDGCWGGVAPALRERRSRNRERVAWLVAAAAVLVATALVAAALLRHASVAPQPPRVEAAIPLPAGFELSSAGSSMAFSPDGQKLVLAASRSDGPQQLWLRATDGSALHALAGTEDATYPFWSADGRSIGFFAEHQLKRIDLSTGSVFTICAAPSGRGGTWNRQGTIVFAPDEMGGLYRVAAAGGTPVQISVPPSAAVSERLPHFLPGGERVIFFSGTGEEKNTANGIYVLDLDTNQSLLLMHGDSEGRYVDRKFLAFVRDGNLMVRRFDARTLQLSGEAITVARNIRFRPSSWTGEYAFSSTGLLVYEPSAPVPQAQLTWLSLDGKTLGTAGAPAPFVWAAVSPGGNEAVAQVRDGKGHSSLWIYDLKRGTRSRLAAADGSSSDPLWSPSGRQIVYQKGSEGSFYLEAANGDGSAKQILSLPGTWGMSDWSPDGRLIAMEAQSADGWDIWMLPMTGKRKPYRFLATPYNESYGTFSPDGRWISYISDESGQAELYIAAFPGRGDERQVSTGGAEFGGWIHGVAELAYITPQDQLMIVKVRESGRDLQIGKPQLALNGRRFPRSAFSFAHILAGPEFFSPDGKKVLLPVPVEKNRTTTLTLVANWRAGGTTH